MTNSLPPELSAFINQSVAAGKYASPDEVVAAGLYLLKERAQETDELRRKLQEGIDALDRGDYIELKNDAAISQFVADHLRRSLERTAAASVQK